MVKQSKKTDCPETPVTNYQSTLSNIPEEGRSHTAAEARNHANMASFIIVNDDQMQLFLAYLFITNQLYVFRAMSSPQTCRAD